MWPDTVDELAYWEDYVKVNEIYANEVILNYQEGDVSKFFKYLIV